MPLIGIAVLHAALITLVGYTEGLNYPTTELREQARILTKSVSAATSVLCLAYFLQGASWIVGGLFCLAGLLHFGALWGWRWRFAEHERAGVKTDARNVLIVGANRVGRHIAAYIQKNPGGRRLCGIIDDEKPLSNGVVGRIPDLARLARQHFVDEIILAAPRDSDVTPQVLNEARRLRLDVEIVPELFGFGPAESEIEQVGGMPVICLHTERLPAVGLFVKRALDVLVAALALSLCAPLLAAIGILIKLDSPGPVFYRAQRAGRKGRSFFCCKFRTMVRNADQLRASLRQHNEREGPIFKLSADPRITHLGRYLRLYSLDELPQLWNVLKGEMSLVGPRPHRLDEFASYEMSHLGRLDITPGITGLWQVTARRDPSFHRAMELDREYIRSWNLGLDFRILLKTIVVVMQGSGQ
jgi:exopolysaccharide biosynthesis polyprenyl glycosylphosphotransferase